jgi:NAD-dependent dihydropyrimidine dehydrogenase PreA subunit
VARKILKATFEDRCNGCELCVMEAQRQLKRVGLSDAPIRILRDNTSSNLYFYVELNENQLKKLDINEIFKVCPSGVFEVIEENDEQLLG